MVLLFKSNIINAPFHWDALTHVRYSLHISEKNIYPNRPSLLFFYLALLYRLFGFSIPLTHISIILISTSVLFFTYKLASYLFNNTIALGSILFLFFSPLFFSQSGIINQSMPVTLMTLLCVYYFFKKRFLLYGLFFILACLTKENALLIFIPIFAVALMGEETGRKKIIILMKAMIPLLIIITFGMVVFHGREFSHLIYYWELVDSGSFLRTLSRIKEVFFDFLNMNVLVLYCLCLSALYLVKKKMMKNKHRGNIKTISLFLCVYIISFLFFFGFYPRFLPRHWLPVYPYMAIMTSYLLVRNFVKKNVLYYLIMFTTIIFSFYLCYKPLLSNAPTGSGAVMERNMSYLNIVKSHKMAAEYIEKKYPGRIIATFWPMRRELRHPQLGYVKTTIKTRDLSFKFFGLPIDNVLNLAPDNFDFILYSPQSHHSKSVYEYIRKLNFEPVYLFEVNGCTSGLYKRNY